jgi:poly-gamma-glutamate synthesis protein (capsule biosynthesis protein)
MKFSFFFTILLLSSHFVSSAQEFTKSVEIVAVGDILLDRGVEKKIEEFGIDYPFRNVKNILSDADIAFGNLENPISNKCRMVEKKYSFQVKPKYTKILNNAGLDIFSLANNHSHDCGPVGLTQTFNNLQKENLLWVGAGRNQTEAESPVFVEKNGIKIAFLAFSSIPVSTENNFPSSISRAEPKIITRSVSSARKNADVVIVSIHWGSENATHPNSSQINLADVAIRSGADAVLGHHPHVLQELKVIKGSKIERPAIVAYSLGNFVFDSPVRLNKRLGESFILKLRFGKNGLIGQEIIPVLIENYRPVIADKKSKNLILSRLSYSSPTKVSFQKLIESDLDFNGKLESIDLNSNRNPTLHIRHGDRPLWQGIPAKWKPWKMEIADVDGNGKKEIIVGVYKATKFFPKPHNCLFIYGWNDQKAYPKWLGSSLSRVFTDFLFADLDKQKGDELIALETTLEGKKRVAIYKWNSFGFTLEWERGEWDKAELSGVENGQISVVADGQNLLITKD